MSCFLLFKNISFFYLKFVFSYINVKQFIYTRCTPYLYWHKLQMCFYEKCFATIFLNQLNYKYRKHELKKNVHVLSNILDCNVSI